MKVGWFLIALSLLLAALPAFSAAEIHFAEEKKENPPTSAEKFDQLKLEYEKNLLNDNGL